MNTKLHCADHPLFHFFFLILLEDLSTSWEGDTLKIFWWSLFVGAISNCIVLVQDLVQ